MTDAAHGFKRIGDRSDHTIARWCRQQKCIDNFQTRENSCTWFGPDGRAVLVIFYDSDLSKRVCVREDLYREWDWR
jgi:hypothetical protein